MRQHHCTIIIDGNLLNTKTIESKNIDFYIDMKVKTQNMFE